MTRAACCPRPAACSSDYAKKPALGLATQGRRTINSTGYSVSLSQLSERRSSCGPRHDRDRRQQRGQQPGRPASGQLLRALQPGLQPGRQLLRCNRWHKHQHSNRWGSRKRRHSNRWGNRKRLRSNRNRDDRTACPGCSTSSHSSWWGSHTKLRSTNQRGNRTRHRSNRWGSRTRLRSNRNHDCQRGDRGCSTSSHSSYRNRWGNRTRLLRSNHWGSHTKLRSNRNRDGRTAGRGCSTSVGRCHSSCQRNRSNRWGSHKRLRSNRNRDYASHRTAGRASSISACSNRSSHRRGNRTTRRSTNRSHSNWVHNIRRTRRTHPASHRQRLGWPGRCSRRALLAISTSLVPRLLFTAFPITLRAGLFLSTCSRGDCA